MAGVPARDVGSAGCEEPALVMDQLFVGETSDRRCVKHSAGPDVGLGEAAVTRDEIIKLERYLKVCSACRRFR